MNRGNNFYKQGDSDAAVASYTKAIEYDPQNADAYHHRGVVRSDRGYHAAAVEDFTKAIKAETRSPGIHYFARGVAQHNRRNYDAAIADYTEAIKFDAYNADAYYGRGLAHHRKGSLDAAVADYDRAIEIVPPVAKAFGARGAAKLAQGWAVRSLSRLRRGTASSPITSRSSFAGRAPGSRVFSSCSRGRRPAPRESYLLPPAFSLHPDRKPLNE